MLASKFFVDHLLRFKVQRKGETLWVQPVKYHVLCDKDFTECTHSAATHSAIVMTGPCTYIVHSIATVM